MLAIFDNKNNPNRWRPCERESLAAQFGEIREADLGDSFEEGHLTANGPILWRLRAESLSKAALERALEIQGRATLRQPQCNRPTGWVFAHAKDWAFRSWNRHGVPVPVFGPVRMIEDMIALRDKLPILVRLNYLNTGEGSRLCRTYDDLLTAWQDIPMWYAHAETRYGPGVARALMWAEFIETGKEGYRYSYRIHVCGDEVVSGYARLCGMDEWVAITGKFTPAMADIFLARNIECADFCKTHRAEIVRAVHVLGLDWQGVDVIVRQNGAPVFLEVQPYYSCGNPRYGDKPPWYNPSYPELVAWLRANWEVVERLIPWYAARWLHKEGHFSACAKALAKSWI